jgi:hypothetical protein
MLQSTGNHQPLPSGAGADSPAGPACRYQTQAFKMAAAPRAAAGRQVQDLGVPIDRGQRAGL